MQKLFANLIPREQYSSRSLRVALTLTTERLGSETRRADDAERRVAEVLHTLRLHHDSMMLAQAELSRAKEELIMYKFRLEEAQREILRANEAIDDLQQEKDMAEDEAARARTMARKYREQQLVARAREEGKREAFQDGLSRGTSSGFEGAALAEKFRERGHSAPTVEEMLEEEEPRVSRSTVSRANQSTHTPDSAHLTTSQPVPTLTMTLDVPPASRSHSHTLTSTSVPTLHPVLPSLDPGEVLPPIPIHEPVVYPSLRDPPVVPPDGWIPYAAARNGEIVLPPPHELSRPVSPVSVPQPPLIFQPATRAQPAWSSSGVLSPSQNIYPTTRQESTTATTSSTRKPISMSSQAVSLPSQASTSISQFDLIKAPPWAKRQFPTWSRPPGEDMLPPLDLRPGERVTLPARLRAHEHNRSSDFTKRPERETGRPATNPLEKPFKRRHRTRSPPVAPPVIPDPIIESPSASSTDRSWIELIGPRPSLTAPEPITQPIAPATSQDNIIITPTESPVYNPTILPSISSLADSPAEPVIPPLHDQFPPDFVPLTPPPLPTDMLSTNPIPAPSDTLAPSPPPSNLIPIPIPPPRTRPPTLLQKAMSVSPPHSHDAPLPSPDSENGNALTPVSPRGA